MNRYFLIFAGLISLLSFSCHKSDLTDNDTTNTNDTTTTNPPARSWFKLKTIVHTSEKGSYIDKDSTEIVLDSVNRKVTLKGYFSSPYIKDTTTETYTYNSNYQLALYECFENYDGDQLYISRMEFLRDASGQVTKVISGYKNGLMATSEGPVTYAKRGDTTFITYLDSAKKDPDQYSYAAQDFFTVALLNGKLIAETRYPTKNDPDTSWFNYGYDGAGNLVSASEKYGNATPTVYTYQRGSQAPQNLQKFMTQYIGDLFWFSRAKFFFPLQLIGYDGFIVGNAPISVLKNNAAFLSFTNTFDASGNLTSTTYQEPVPYSGTYTKTNKYMYRP